MSCQAQSLQFSPGVYICKGKEGDLIKLWDFVKLGIIISTTLENCPWVPYLLGSIECTFLIHCCLDIIRVDKTSLDRDPDKRSELIPWQNQTCSPNPRIIIIRTIPLKKYLYTVKPLITNTSKELIKCRILHFLIMECCRYLVF